MNKSSKTKNRQKRHIRVRARIFGTTDKPRLNIFRSLSGMFLQVIDDEKGMTLISVNSKKDIKKSGDAGDRNGKIAESYLLGKTLAEKAKEKNIVSVVFDRGGYAYHGRVKAAAEGARDGGLQF
jgi:large subunit ribosomal protein L18